MRRCVVIAEFVKKTVLGYKEAPGGQSDPECTHVILTLDEYTDMGRKIARAKADADEVRVEAGKQLRKDREDMKKTVDELKQEVEALHQRAEYLDGLNRNLLRIARERANADRKLKPKKRHTGYVVVSSMEKMQRMNRDMVKLWETVLETPYSVEFTEEQVREQTKELTGSGEDETWVVSRIGIDASWDGEYEGLMAYPHWSMEEKKNWNIMLKRRLRANYKTGYWEVSFFHTKPLGIVPADMRAN